MGGWDIVNECKATTKQRQTLYRYGLSNKAFVRKLTMIEASELIAAFVSAGARIKEDEETELRWHYHYYQLEINGEMN